VIGKGALGMEFDSWLKTGDVPTRLDFGPDFQDDYRVSSFRSRERDVFIRDFGYAIPCKEAVSCLNAMSPLLEVGAGTGAWSKILALNGVDIIATDKYLLADYPFITVGTHFPIKQLDAVEAIQRYPDRNVLMIWPCYEKKWSTVAANEIRPSKRLALISEGEGGCVGDTTLFEVLENSFQHIETIRIPCWYGIHDRLDIYCKKERS
jgi:hypothetical protein